MLDNFEPGEGTPRGGGISPRKALLGAVILVILSSAVTYAAVMFDYRALVTGMAGPRENLATMRQLSESPAFERFVTVLSTIRKNYVDQPDTERLLEGAAEGVVSILNDPYSTFMTVREFDHFQTGTGSSYGGVGLQVTDEGKHIVVVAAFPGTPGALTPFEGARPSDPRGLKPRDRIINVDNHDVVGMEVTRAVSFIKGEPGSVVTLRVLRVRDGTERELVFKLIRAKITVPTTRSEVLSPGIGYLQIVQFLDNTGPQVAKEIDSLKADGARGLVLDLRHNPGGRLEASVDVAELFVPEGPVVHVVDRSGKRETYLSKNPNPQGLGLPLVVLVDEATASASEIVAGAIRDRGAGVLVGQPTFGKGLVQQVFELGDGTGLKLTVSKYLTPNGHDINRRVVDEETGREEGGLAPEVEVARPENMDTFEFGVLAKDPQLARAVEVLREEMAGGRRAAGGR